MEMPPIQWNTFVIRLWNDSPSGPWRGEAARSQVTNSATRRWNRHEVPSRCNVSW